MSKADLLLIDNALKKAKTELHEIVKDGTSKNDNRKKYKKVVERITRLNRWKKEIKQISSK